VSGHEPLNCERCGHDVFVVKEIWCKRGRWALAHEQDSDGDPWTVLVQALPDDPTIPLPKYERWCERCNTMYLDSADDWRPKRYMSDEELNEFLSWLEREGGERGQ
jgi:hypothetical protein